jgi:choline-sulfatase
MIPSKEIMMAGVMLLVAIFIIASFALYLILYRSSPEETFECRGCNVILVSFDALQARHVHSLGYPKNITPTIDSMADQGFNFKQAISASSWTVPASMTWFTGNYPSQHKVLNKFAVYNDTDQILSNLKELSPGTITLAEVLKQNGYVTGGFTGDAGVSGVFGYNQGFDAYIDDLKFGGQDYSIPFALDWLRENKGKKFFMFLHGYDVHGQHVPEGGFDYRYVDFDYGGPFNGSAEQQASLREEGLEKGYVNITKEDVLFWRAVYDEKISRVDYEFSKFLDGLEELGLMNNTVLVLTSDHGTEFYEHKRFDHGFSLYDELVHVPLIIVHPRKTGGKEIDLQVRSLDIMPTILDMLDIPLTSGPEEQLEGESLVPLMKGEQLELDAFIETDYRQYTYKRALRAHDGWKFIYTLESGEKELYNLINDSGEQSNLIEKEPRMAYELEQELLNHLKYLGQDPYKGWAVGCYPVYMTQCQ